MNVTIKRQAQDIDPDFARELRNWNDAHPGPDVAVFWNSMSVCLDRERDIWDPRWEVWVEVTDNSHPNNKFLDKENDTYHAGKRWRFLNTYKNDDGSFAPLDTRFFRGLDWADSWRSMSHYEDTVVSVDKLKRERELQMTRDIAYGLASYWRDFGDDVSKVGTGRSGNWRRTL